MGRRETVETAVVVVSNPVADLLRLVRSLFDEQEPEITRAGGDALLGEEVGEDTDLIKQQDGWLSCSRWPESS